MTWSERWGLVLVYHCSESMAFEVPARGREGVSVRHLTSWSPWNRIFVSSHAFRLLTWSPWVQYYKISKYIKPSRKKWNSYEILLITLGSVLPPKCSLKVLHYICSYFLSFQMMSFIFYTLYSYFQLMGWPR